MKKEVTTEQVMTAVAEKEIAHNVMAGGIPGILSAAVIAPNCIMVREERIGFPYVYCCN
jgi:hypothetical protein